MTYHHSWLYLLTLTYDLTYDLWLMNMTITYDLWLWPIIINYHLWLPLTTHNCHSCLIHNHHLSHMSITHDYHIWLSHMTITCNYDLITHDYVRHLWTSPMNIRSYALCLTPYDSSLVSITQDCYPWLSSMTMFTTADHVHHQWTWLSPMNMTITHDYEYHSQPITTHD